MDGIINNRLEKEWNLSMTETNSPATPESPLLDLSEINCLSIETIVDRARASVEVELETLGKLTSNLKNGLRLNVGNLLQVSKFIKTVFFSMSNWGKACQYLQA